VFVGARKVGREELIRTADFVTIHCPYRPENHHLINDETLAMMKPTAYLINASRGRMVDEAALVRALKDKIIKGAALDVYEMEPEINPGLLDLENVVLAPHVGTWSYDARVAMMHETLTGIRSYLDGKTPFNIFNRDDLEKYGKKRI
jgi:lactate dehydrogenase-like 2-hydroxyacid dehydrogenase